MSKALSFGICLSLLLSLFLWAQDSSDQEKKLKDLLPPQELLFFHYIFQPGNDLKNQYGTFDLHEYRTGIEPVFELLNSEGPEALYLSVGFRYTGYNFRFEIAHEHENRSLHALEFPIGLTFMTDKWLASGYITSGIYSDFRGLNRHDSQVNGGVLVGYLFHPSFFFQIGVFATNDFGDLTVIPVGGFIWQPISTFNLEVFAPFHAKLNFYYSKYITLFLSYELDGNQFRFRYRDNGKVEEEDGQFTFYRFGAGADFFLYKGVSFKLTLGGTLGGRYEFRGLTFKDSGRIEGTFYLLVGFTIDERLWNALFEEEES